MHTADGITGVYTALGRWTLALTSSGAQAARYMMYESLNVLYVRTNQRTDSPKLPF